MKKKKNNWNSKAEELLNEAEKILAKLDGYIKFVAALPKHNKKTEL